MNNQLELKEKVATALLMQSAIKNGIDITIENSINQIKNYKIPNLPNIRVANTYQDLLNSYFLRSISYKIAGYDKEFKNVAKGLDYDEFDSTSITFLYEEKGTIAGSFRIILDSEIGLLSEKYSKHEVEKIRAKTPIIEVSRLVIAPEFKINQGRILYFLLMTYAEFARLNNFEVIYSAQEHIIKLYENNFASQTIHKTNIKYGEISDVVLASFKPNQIKPSFKKKFNAMISKIENKTIKSLEQVWDEYAQSYDYFYAQSLKDIHNEVILRIQGSSLADFGCGVGKLRPILDASITYHGIDSNTAMLNIAKNNHGSIPNTSFTLNNVTTTVLDKKVDTISIINVLYAIEDKVTVATVLKNIYDSLNKGGKVILTTLNNNFDSQKLDELIIRECKAQVKDKESELMFQQFQEANQYLAKLKSNKNGITLFTKEEIITLLQNTGFKLEEKPIMPILDSMGDLVSAIKS